MAKIRITGFVLTVVCGALLLLGCGSKAQPNSTKEANSDLGEQLFTGQLKPEVNCAKCHEGGEGPNLSKRVSGLSDAEIMTVIVEGKMNMPAFGNLLAEKEREALINCLRARFGARMGNDAPSAEPADTSGSATPE